MININRLIKCIALVIILTMLVLSTNVEAKTLKEMSDAANSFIEEGSHTDIDFDPITEEFAGLGSILTTIGAGVMVAVVTYMGIKYLISGPEAQAKLKTQLIGVAVSGCVIFGAYAIWTIVVSVAQTF